MSDFKINIDVSSIWSTLVSGLKNKNSAPLLLFTILFIFTVLVIVVIVIFLFKFLIMNAESQHSKDKIHNEEIIKTYSESLKNTTPVMNDFKNELSALYAIVTDLNQIRNIQNNTDIILKDHEKRISKIESASSEK